MAAADAGSHTNTWPSIGATNLGSSSSSRSPVHHLNSWDTGTEFGTHDQVNPTNMSTGGFFSNANNFSVDHPIMGERIEVHGGIHHVYQHYHEPNFFLEKMKAQYVTIEAEFDSSDRENAPKCHPNTRTRFLQKLEEWSHSESKIIWLYGPAGVGKSAIMQTLAETLASSAICLSFFFSRPSSHDNPRKVFPTLAYRLAIADPVYRRYLEENLVTDPDFIAKTLEEQFKRLFIVPIANGRLNTIPRCVIVLDGLDEVDDSRAQRRILDLIRDFVERGRGLSIPLSWVIASRPEPHLQVSFSRIEEQAPNNFRKLEVPIDSDEAAREVELYVRAAFKQIQEDFWDVVPAHWPSEVDLLKVVTTSSGLFVFASTSMAYIGDENPVHRLRDIVELIGHYKTKRNSTRPGLTRNPFELLDVLYHTILDSIPCDTLPTTRVVLGFYLLHERVTGKPPLIVACKILGYDPAEVYVALRRLHSVLRFPPQDDPNTPLTFLHGSFSDFLRDELRSKKHWIDMGEEMRRAWRCYVRVFRQLLKTDRPELISLTRKKLEKRLRSDALLNNHHEHNWLRILATYCHSLPCHCGLSYHLVLDTAELVRVFKEFSSVLFCRELRQDPHPWSIEQWLFCTPRYAPSTLLEQLHQKTMRLDEFTEHDFDHIFEGLLMGRPAYYSVFELLSKVDATDLDEAEWIKIKHEPAAVKLRNGVLELRDDWRVLGDLMHLKKNSQTKHKVIILGMGKDALWAMISGMFLFRGFLLSHITLPYIESTDNQ